MTALAQAAGAAKTSPFRAPVRSGRIVSVLFTEFAPEKHRRSKKVLYGPPLDTAVAVIADDLGREPGELKVLEGDEGQIRLAARMRHNSPSWMAKLGRGPAPDPQLGTVQVVATVTGISAREFALGLTEIQRPSWRMVTR